jgi:hypothetical protein
MESENKEIQEVKDESLDENIGVEFTTSHDYIASAFYSMSAISDIDMQILNKADYKRIARIKRQSIRIISECLNELYGEIFEEDDED